MKPLSKLFTAAIVAAAAAFAMPAFAQDGDAGAIRHLMMATFDKPESPLTVEPVTIHQNVAVAGWAQGDMGGRALLKRKGEDWVLTLCSGEALKEAKALQHFGLTPEEADAMARAVVDAESKLDPALVAKFSTFDGVVMMDAEGNHPPADGHGAAHGTHGG